MWQSLFKAVIFETQPVGTVGKNSKKNKSTWLPLLSVNNSKRRGKKTY